MKPSRCTSNRYRSLGLVLAAVLLHACAGFGTGPGTGEPYASDTAAIPADVRVRYENAIRELEAGNHARAQAGFNALVRDHPGYSGPYRQLAVLAADDGDRDAAIAWLERALEVCGNCAPVLNELGVLAREAGRFEAAESAYREAIGIDPGYAPVHFNLAVLYELYLQQPRLAVRHYERYLELADNEPAAGEIRAWVADLERRSQAVGSTTAEQYR